MITGYMPWGLCVAVPLSLVTLSATSERVPTLTVEGDAGAGHVTLQWNIQKSTPTAEFQLQEATNRDFKAARTQYKGPHHASVISGLANGIYYYRVRYRPGSDQPWQSWSTPQSFEVKHHSLSLAFTLFGLGAAVFLVTLIFLVTWSRKSEL